MGDVGKFFGNVFSGLGKMLFGGGGGQPIYAAPFTSNPGPAAQRNQGTARMRREAVASWRLVYGRVRVSGPMVFFHVNGDFLHVVLPVAAHEIDAFETIYLDDTPVEINAGGAVLTEPWLRTPNNQSWHFVVGDRGQIGDTVYIPTGQQLGLGTRVLATVGGAPRIYEYVGTSSSVVVTGQDGATFTFADRDNWYWEFNQATGKIITAELPSIWRPDGTFRDDRWLDVTVIETAWIYCHHGQESQTANPLLVANADGLWTEAHRLRGHAYIYAIFRWDPDVYSSGIPNISAVIRGKRVHNPATGSLTWSQNAALCLRDYMLHAERLGGFGCQESELHTESWQAAAALCDEDVQTLDGPEPRYTINGLVDTAQAPQEIIAGMISAMAGYMPYIGGQWHLRPAEYTLPVLDLDESHLRGTMRVRPKRSRTERYNIITGVFTSPRHCWQPTSYPAVHGGIRGEERAMDLPQDYVTSDATCQRLAKIELGRIARQIEVDYPVMAIGLQVAPCDVVTLTNQRLGWDRKPFFVQGWAAAEDGGFDLTLLETGPEIYRWVPLDQTRLEPAPPLDLPEASTVAAVASLHAQAWAEGGGFNLVWPSSDQQYLAGYDVQWVPVGSQDWQGQTVSPMVVQLPVNAATGAWRARVRARNIYGVTSLWTYVEHIAVADTGPGLPMVAQVSGLPGSMYLIWTNPSDPDLASLTILAGTSDNAALAQELVTLDVQPGRQASYVHEGLADGAQRWYWLRATSTSGEQSGLAGPFAGLSGAGDSDSPASLASLAMWLDASDTSAMTKDASNRVSQWRDKSGGVVHAAQATLAARPIYTAGGLDFNGSSQFLEVSGFEIGASFAVFAWIRSDLASWPQDNCLVNSRDPSGFLLHPNGGSRTWLCYLLDTAVGYHNFGWHTPDNIQEWHLYGMSFNHQTGACRQYFDGMLAGEDARPITRAASLLSFLLGKDHAEPRYYNGLIHQLYIYNRHLSLSDAATLYIYGRNALGL